MTENFAHGLAHDVHLVASGLLLTCKTVGVGGPPMSDILFSSSYLPKSKTRGGLDIFNLAEMREQPYLAFPSMWSHVAFKGEQQQCPDKWMAKLPFIGSENFVT